MRSSCHGFIGLSTLWWLVADVAVLGALFSAPIQATASDSDSAQAMELNATIEVAEAGGKVPDGIIYNPKINQLYIANEESGTVTIVHPDTYVVEHTIPLTRSKVPLTPSGKFSENDPVGLKVGSHPEGITVNPNTGKLYVTNNGSSTFSIITP